MSRLVPTETSHPIIHDRIPTTVPLIFRHPQTSGPCPGVGAVLAMWLGWTGVATAQTPPSAAEIDWRPRDQLPAPVRARLPVFCAGGYVPADSGGAEGVALDVGPDTSQPLRAEALSARYEMDRELRLDGDVRLRQGRFSVTGSSARYDQAAGRVSLTGPLVSRGEGFLLTGDSADYDVGSGLFDLTDASFLLHGPEIRGTAGSLSRTGDETMVIRGGSLTTCAPDSNAWSLRAAAIRLDRDAGFGTARHLRLEVKDVPVFYWPWASFPIDDRRKSGFLYPAFGTSNTGSGAFLSVPYYFNLAPHYDATLTPQYMHGRGPHTEVEGRYLSDLGPSVLQLGYINDDAEFRREFPGRDGERWALDFSTRARFGERWQGYGDYAVVSDDDYLSDLNQTLDISRTSFIERRGGVRYQDRHQYFEAFVAGYQTLNERLTADERPYEQLPEVLYDLDRQWGSLSLGLESQYTRFHRDNSGLTGLDRANGQRLRLLPELALPLRALWGYTRPSVTLDQTWYDLEGVNAGERSFERTVPVFEWDSGLYFDRRGSIFDAAYNQSLEPRLYYALADADSDQTGIPDFDSDLRSFRFDNLFRRNRFVGGDRVGDANQLTVALTSRFNALATGAERARFSLGQVYYYDDREVSLDGEGASSRSDSPLAGEAVLRPLDTLDIRTTGLWDPRTETTEEGRSELVFHSRDYRYLASLGHTYRRGDFEQTDIGAVFPVTDRVSLIGRWIYDSRLQRTVGTLAGIEYNNCCWSVQVVGQSYLTEERELDNRILFQIQLKGLGGTGGSASELTEAFRGFDERERRRFGTRQAFGR